MHEVSVFAPATVANVACGFDMLGFAIDAPGDEVVLRRSDREGVRITAITGDGGELPADAKRNTAGVAVLAFLAALGRRDGTPACGLELELHKHMPLASGLGSSAASAVAGAVAANELFGRPFGRDELLPFAMEGERAACGAAHADNAAPCLFGGFRAVRSYSPLDVFGLPVPKELRAIVVHPHCELSTAYSRSVLPAAYPRSAATAQMGAVASFVAALYTGDYGRLSASLADFLAEPYRASHIPGFAGVKEAALAAGALGCSISGSGPSIFALAGPGSDPDRIASAMQEGFRLAGLASDRYVSPINERGAEVR